MTQPSEAAPGAEALWLERARLQQALDLLLADGYRLIGPTVQQGAILYDEIRSVDELPQGWTDVQEPAKYRLARRNDRRWFGFNVGPQSWKQFLFPPRSVVATAQRTAAGWQLETPVDREPALAFLGVRACELAAMAVQDRVFLQAEYQDPVYARRRAAAFLIAVDCAQSACTCFCVSMDTGPACRAGFDWALTELDDGFVVRCGSLRGGQLAERLQLAPASRAQLDLARGEPERAAAQQTRRMPPEEARHQLRNRLEHPRWDEVAQRCLSCTNCTQVCPTCFCSSVHEVADLDATQVSRERVWDSCFNLDLSYMNGGVVRNGIRARYRQWLTHKVDTWHDQFGLSGCVGCGRCITWCPVGIDLTEEVAAIAGEGSPQA